MTLLFNVETDELSASLVYYFSFVRSLDRKAACSEMKFFFV